jgi:hypothetical protein
VSVLTKKRPVSDASGLREQAAYAAQKVAPLASKTKPMAQQAAQQAQLAAQQAAQQAVPLARSAGASVRQGADTAAAWAAPRVDAARSWAAPQIEQTARAISENLAPMISGALVSAAHKIDAKPKKSRRSRAGLIAGVVLLTAAAGAAAAVVLQRRRDAAGYPAPDGTDSADAATYEAGATPDPDMNGHPRIV